MILSGSFMPEAACLVEIQNRPQNTNNDYEKLNMKIVGAFVSSIQP